ncbi:hypothetical protein B4102_0907 [Heyndrickxia sporothermodurans]|uniref:Competence protein CoiA n=1 Tax=Heyndrickxia sporothermodurans TaxID=46224 RepID=A0A150KQ23_9BACI|nr:competence protein CoiA family protein [Heyndrickxia sporothermodurans]KYC97252.1 hypothetical protein B4102_0907 [Heyndrickxia sporothermodurans]
MLTAITKNRELYCLLYPESKEKLMKIRGKTPLYCPQCYEEVIVKIGKIKIPHFAHKTNTKCTSSEPESERHLQGKIDLFSWLKAQRLNVEMEKFFPEINQRSDLYVQKHGKKYAIEFQCSAIPIEEIEKRTEGYSSIDIVPVWLLGGEPYQKKFTLIDNVFKVSDFQWSLAQYNSTNGMHIYSYSPETKNITILSHLAPISIRKVFAQQMTYPLASVDFPLNLPNKNDKKFDWNFWFHEKKNMLRNKIIYASNLKDSFLATAYYNRHSPILFPPLIGIPVKFMEICKTHVSIWQYFIWCDSFKHLNKGNETSLALVVGKFEERVLNGDIQLRKFPLIHVKFLKQMIYHYLKLLSKFGYLEETRKGRFTMNKSIPFPNNIEEAARMENEFMNTFYK